MKKTLLILILAIFSFLFTGCGGGGGDDDSSSSSSSSTSSSTHEVSSSSYDIWDYIIPNKLTSSNHTISTRSIDGTTYNATFRSINENDTVEEIPANTSDERIIYEKENNSIKVKFYKNDKITYYYLMKRFLQIGEQTIPNSSCMLVNHYNSKTFNDKEYNDIIEIDCGTQKGYYAKNKGQVYQE